MTEYVGQRFLHDAVDREIGGLAGFAEFVRDRRLDGDVGVGFVPQTQQGAQRLAKSELRQADGTQLLQYAARELLQRVDLIENRAAMPAQCGLVRLMRVGL